MKNILLGPKSKLKKLASASFFNFEVLLLDIHQVVLM